MYQYLLILFFPALLLCCQSSSTTDNRLVQKVVEEATQDSTPVFMEGFSFEKSDGTTFSFNEVKGKVLLLDFWATTCGPCIREHPKVEKIYEAINNPDFELINISTDHKKEQWIAFLEKNKWKGTNIIINTFDSKDPLGNMVKKTIQNRNGETMQMVSVPQYFLIDKSLNVEKIEATDLKNLEDKIKELTN